MTLAEVDALFAALDGSAEALDALAAHIGSCLDAEICPVCLNAVKIDTLSHNGDIGMTCRPCNRVFPGWIPPQSSALARPETRQQVSDYWRTTWTDIREGRQFPMRPDASGER